MKMNLEKLVEKFNSIEQELTAILNEKPIDFDESTQKTLIKKSLKEYIKKVNKAKKLFEEYEVLAKQIADATSDEGESAALAKTELDESLMALPKVSKDNRGESKSKDKASKPTKNKSAKESVKEF